ncbi:hypothetical protein ACSAZL_08000 [Methanosarcina sp. T3]
MSFFLSFCQCFYGKGGIGKSTAFSNLSAVLSDLGH